MGFAFRMQGSRAKRVTVELSAAFTNVTGQALNTAITSNAPTASGFPGGSAITVGVAGTGATVQYKINSGSFTSSAGTLDPSDSVTLRVTTAALFLGSLTTVTVTIAGKAFTWTVVTITPAPAFASPTLVMGFSAQLAGTGGTPALTTVGDNTNTNNRNAVLAILGATGGDNNNLVATGTVNNLTLAANTLMHLQVVGTYTNHMYRAEEYLTQLHMQSSVAPSLDAGVGGDDNAQANTQFGRVADGQPIGPAYEFQEEWNPDTSGITSNSQAVKFNLFANAPGGVTILHPTKSAHVGVTHAGHPGASSSTFCMFAFSIELLIVRKSDDTVIHNLTASASAPLVADTRINFLPA